MGKRAITRIFCLLLAGLFLVSGGLVVAVGAESAVTSNLTEKSIFDYIDTLNTDSYEQYRVDHEAYFANAPIRTGNEVTYVFDATENWEFWTGGIDSRGNGSGSSVSMGASGWVLTDTKGNTYTVEEATAAGYSVSNLASIGTYDGKSALYTPGTGSVTWKLDLAAAGITETGLYTLSLEYYPIEGKTISITREFFINYEAPFTEARALTFAKIWEPYRKSGDTISQLYAIYKPEKKIQKNAEKLEAALSSVKNDAAALGLTVREKTDKSGWKYLEIDQPAVQTQALTEFTEKYGLRFFEVDDNNNELRPTAIQAPSWQIYALRDSDGYYTEDFGFLLTPDENGHVTITLKGINEPMALASFILTPYTVYNSYENYIADIKNNVGDRPGTSVLKIEAEYTSATSTNVVYPVEDRASAATSPSDTKRTLLNTIGTEKWETAGQWVEYTFRVDDSGLYNVYSRFRQSYLDGMYVSRSLQIFTDYASKADYMAAHNGSVYGYYNGIPFAEAAQLRYDYDNSWQMTGLTNADSKDGKDYFEIYLEAGVVYTFRFEVTLGSMSEKIHQIEDILNALNDDYLNIIKLTGSSPDSYRDYSFMTLLPDTIVDLARQAENLTNLSTVLKKNTASTYTGICDKLANLLDDMSHNENSIAKNLDNFKSYVGSLGTFLTDAKTQPLQLDYLLIQPSTQKVPKANSNFFKTLWHEISGFIQSFFRDYNNMGAKSDIESSSKVEVWLAYGRDQAQVIRSLCTNNFTTASGIAVDLKLVSGGTLLPSILADMGPDAYIGLGQADVINYAIRGALMNIEDMEDYDNVASNFNDAAMVVLQMDDADGVTHCYGLPENQQFPMMFVRIDILADLGIEIPKTWEDIYIAQSTLESNNMMIGVPNNYKIFLYQQGGELFADNGMRINLDSQVGLEAFETMCNLFTQYSFPYSYNAANRFRTGEMPIIISDYTALYNHLKVFATELDGSWTFVPLPGYEQADGSINNCSVSTSTATVMIKGKKDVSRERYDTEEAYRQALKDEYGDIWTFVKWYSGAECQVDYATEMVAIIGDSAKHSTANEIALESMPWTEEERIEVIKQFSNLASIPNYPGYYIIDRYTNFAFLSAYNDKADPSTELLSYINTINKEITRKREEFNLETLQIGQTLAEKRSDQANRALSILADQYHAKQDGSQYRNAYDTARSGIVNQKIEDLESAALQFARLLGGSDLEGVFLSELHGTSMEKKNAVAQLKTQPWFVYVSKQTAEQKNGGYEISSLNEQQLVYFIAECLANIAGALASY